MNPTSLFNVPSHLLREHVQSPAAEMPVAARGDRFWAGIACLALVLVVPALIALLH